MSLVFGIHLLADKVALAPVLTALGDWLGVKVEDVESYDRLQERMKDGSIDLAWLPPIVYLRLGEGVVTPIVSSRRDGRAGYETALIVREDSKFKAVEDLKGGRAAWVDAWSAAGYVIPRVRLRLGGINPTVLFASETFYGSHSAAVGALLDDKADVAATYALVSESGEVTGGGWQGRGNVRVLTSFGEIPTDMIAVRSSMAETDRATLKEKLLKNDQKEILKKLFAADELGPVDLERYETLRSIVSLAESLGVSK